MPRRICGSCATVHFRTLLCYNCAWVIICFSTEPPSIQLVVTVCSVPDSRSRYAASHNRPEKMYRYIVLCHWELCVMWLCSYVCATCNLIMRPWVSYVTQKVCDLDYSILRWNLELPSNVVPQGRQQWGHLHIKTRWWEDGLVKSVVDCEHEVGMDHIASASAT